MRRLAILVVAGSVALAPGPLAACRLALVLALDVSSSVDQREERLQRRGLAAALRDEAVRDAFLVSPRPVALHVFQWSGRYDQSLLIPDWRMIRTASDLDVVALSIERGTRSRSDRPTAMGYALGFASILIDQGPDCDFATIDVSGDGTNNEGFGPVNAYAAFPFDSVTVNGLAIVSDEGSGELVPYYRAEVIRGPGAFVEIAAGYADFRRAMVRKLLAELQVQVVGAAGSAPRAHPPRWPAPAGSQCLSRSRPLRACGDR